MTLKLNQSKQLEERTINFSVSIIKAFSNLSTKPELKPIVIQIIKSSTSIGANYAEANNASSKQDFKNKIFISKKEASETCYWLNVFQKLFPEKDYSKLLKESHELTLIIQKIISTMKASEKNGK
jgi:four helix bundle protein